MQKLAIVEGVRSGTGCVETFYLPIQETESKERLREFFVKVPYEYAGSLEEAKYYIRKYLTDDEELPKLVDLPSNLYELDEFLTRWSALDVEQKRTTVALVENEYEPLKALELAEKEVATIIDIETLTATRREIERSANIIWSIFLIWNTLGRSPNSSEFTSTPRLSAATLG